MVGACYKFAFALDGFKNIRDEYTIIFFTHNVKFRRYGALYTDSAVLSATLMRMIAVNIEPEQQMEFFQGTRAYEYFLPLIQNSP